MSAIIRITLFQVLYSLMWMILSILVFSCVFAGFLVVDVLVGHLSASVVFSISSLLTDGRSSSGFVSHGGTCPRFCSFRMKVLASNPLVMGSAGLLAVGQYLHGLYEVKSLIICTRCLTNCRCGCLVEDIHDNAILESLHNMHWSGLYLASTVVDR